MPSVQFRHDFRLLRFAQRCFRWATRKIDTFVHQRGAVVTVHPAGRPKGTVTLAYHADPWIYPDTREKHYHTNRWECGLFGDTFVEAGYRLDVVEFDNPWFELAADCEFIIDLERNLDRFARTAPHSVKIQHASTTHWLHWNRAELARIARIAERRGVALQPRRQIPFNLTTEAADRIIYVGNAFTAESYAFAKKPLQRIPISAVAEYPWPERKNWEAARRNYFWFGSVGLVHKGLDLALEAFARMPDVHLWVAGGIDLDQDFKAAYHHELFKTPNIHCLGWVDILKPDFLEVLHRCAGVVYPSCAEGGAGSVICCMHGGLIPIVTRQASVDVGDFGIEHRDDSIETIVADVRRVAQMPATELAARARAGWEHVRRMHTRKNFCRVWRDYARTELHLELTGD